jgi:hypothetical protein
MAELNHTVNPDEVEESFAPVPAGEYISVIESSDYVDNKAKTGKILRLTYQIIDGQFKGRKLFNNLNLVNQSAQTVEIAKKSLNSIGLAVGVIDIKDSSQLHDTPFKIDVGIKEDKTYGLQNTIKKHTKIEAGNSNTPPANTNTSQNAAAQDAQTEATDAAAVESGVKKKQAWET